MRLTLTLIFVMLFNALGVSQSLYDFKLYKIESSNLEAKIDTISAKNFDKTKVANSLPEYLTKDPKGLLKSSLKKFSKSLILRDSCLLLKTSKEEVKLCNNISEKIEKTWISYKLVGEQNGFLVFLEEGYEWWQFTLFNPETGEHHLVTHSPHFISKDLVFSYGNYYAEGQFEILDLTNNKHFSFESYDWELSSVYRIKNEFYLEFRSNEDFNEMKYLKITY